MAKRVFAERYGAWAIVTGASDGIGAALARELAARGVNLILVARRRARLEALAAELRPAEVEIVEADLALPAGNEALLQAVAGRDVGLLVPAAGFGLGGAFVGHAAGDEAAMVDLNCRAVVTLVHALAPALIARGRGGIVLFSSLVAFQGVPRAATYTATKAFVQAFGEGLASELRPHGVDVLVCAPGPVESGFGGRAGMAMSGADRPDAVAADIAAALGRTGFTRPGRKGRWLSRALAGLPRSARIAILRRVMARMTGHGGASTAGGPA